MTTTTPIAPSGLTAVQADTFTHLFPHYDPDDEVQRIIASAIGQSDDFSSRYLYSMDAVVMIGHWILGEEREYEWDDTYDTAINNWSDPGHYISWRAKCGYSRGLMLACLAGLLVGKQAAVTEVVNSRLDLIDTITTESTVGQVQDVVWDFINNCDEIRLPFAWVANLSGSTVAVQ